VLRTTNAVPSTEHVWHTNRRRMTIHVACGHTKRAQRSRRALERSLPDVSKYLMPCQRDGTLWQLD
jgi:hypothetical protein